MIIYMNFSQIILSLCASNMEFTQISHRIYFTIKKSEIGKKQHIIQRVFWMGNL